MIVCKVCGTRNNDQEEFCTSCGRYLAWSGEHIDVAPEAEPELVVADALPEAQPEGFFRRLAVRLHLTRPAAHPVPVVGPPAEEEHATEEPGVRVLGALPASAPARLAAGPSGALPAGGSERADTAGAVAEGVLVIPEVVGASAAGSEPTAPMALVGNGDATRALRPRRPGESPPKLPVLPPLPGREPPPSERATVLRRPTEVVDKPRSRRARPGSIAGLPELASGPSPGDVFCPRCGQFNSPSRVYCRRCGLELAPRVLAGEEVPYEPLTWWQRHLHHDVHVVGAGQRPGRWGKIVSGAGSQGRTLRIIERVGAVLIGVSLLLTFIGPYSAPIQNWYTNTWHAMYNYVDAREVGVSASSASATSSAPGHSAFLAVDGASNTWWQSKTVPLPKPPPKHKSLSAKTATTAKTAKTAKTGAHGSTTASSLAGGAGAASASSLAGSATASSLAGAAATSPKRGVASALGHKPAHPGAKATKPKTPPPPPKPVVPGVGQELTIQFAAPTNLNRVAWLSGVAGTLAAFDAVGRPHKVEIFVPGRAPATESLADIQALQPFKLVASNISSLRVKILSVYPGSSVRAVAITEIEFFTKQ